MTTATGDAAQAPSDEEFLTVREVAEQFRVSLMTIYTAINAGDLEAVRVGKRRGTRVQRRAVRRFLEQRIVCPTTPAAESALTPASTAAQPRQEPDRPT